jgi:hypothetical protein
MPKTGFDGGEPGTARLLNDRKIVEVGPADRDWTG